MYHVPIVSATLTLEPAPECCYHGIVFDEDRYDLIGTLCPYEATLFSLCTAYITKVGLKRLQIQTCKHTETHWLTELDALTQELCSFETALIISLKQHFGESITSRTLLVAEHWQVCEITLYEHSCNDVAKDAGSIGDTVYVIPLNE